MKLVELGTILEIHRGKMPLNFSDSPKEGFLPYVDIEAFEKGVVKRYTDGKNAVPCEANQVLVVDRGSRFGLVGKALKGFIGSTLVKVQSPELDNNYLFYYLQSQLELLRFSGKAAMIPQIDWKFLKEQKIPLPSLNEQQKIVEPLVLLDVEGGASSAFKNSADFIKKQSLKRPLKAN
ncbi:type I restriction modification system HsdS component [Candidatus Mycoplasma haematolamae str. Purdue]|uniref:Type I restriction modification system HsdS component n=1 Tax=Mycoplasma haematolamae (strain Purdue) TaxID=1212765 RepID=I7CEK3_MYCHA|nr:restriction endonuclease subunit S [Candidatus Mycoplasma haematolamae]AFO51671.1 type I restriction modification system HsdS component [Candidatus Mycoplasma haematolamae str. Purdue]